MNMLLFRCCNQILGRRLGIPNLNVARFMRQVVQTTDFDESKDVEHGKFSKYNISEEMEKRLKDAGINHLFAVQYDTFNHIREGKDAIVQARTGTGKTLAFALPILENLREEEDELCLKKGRSPVVLTLAPTRELAVQIYKEFEKFKSWKMKVSCFYGGTSYYSQDQDLYNGIDILVGTPGRILDHIEKDNLDCSNLKHVILDEADRMMDMGFQNDLEQILSNAYTEGNKPQTLMFSATIPPWVSETAKKYTSSDTKRFDLIGKAVKSAVLVEHKVIRCSYRDRAATIRDLIQVHSGKYGKTIVFTSTKQEANELALNSVISTDCQVLHGEIAQNQREITLDGFRNDKFNCLIATDVAARGLDIPKIDLVIQTEPPQDLDSYIHRAGRTGRAGKNGVCIVLYKQGQERDIDAVERRAGISFTEINVPHQNDVLLSYANDALKSLDEVKSDAIEHFLSSAKGRIESQGAEHALAAALAVIAGVTDLESRKRFKHHDSFKNNVRGHGYGESSSNNVRGHRNGDSFNNARGRRYGDSFNKNARGHGYGDSFNNTSGRGYGARGERGRYNPNEWKNSNGNDNFRYNNRYNDNNHKGKNKINNYNKSHFEDDMDDMDIDAFDNQRFSRNNNYEGKIKKNNYNNRYKNWLSTFEDDSPIDKSND